MKPGSLSRVICLYLPCKPGGQLGLSLGGSTLSLQSKGSNDNETYCQCTRNGLPALEPRIPFRVVTSLRPQSDEFIHERFADSPMDGYPSGFNDKQLKSPRTQDGDRPGQPEQACEHITEQPKQGNPLVVRPGMKGHYE